jgi:hypothetical protein
VRPAGAERLLRGAAQGLVDEIAHPRGELVHGGQALDRPATGHTQAPALGGVLQ